MGRNKFSNDEIIKIAKLLHRKERSKRFQQKEIRHQLRVDFDFNISDFNEPGKAFGVQELSKAIERRAIQILDDATIADMKARYAEEKEKRAAQQVEETVANGETTDWQAALKEWQDWENSQKE